MIQDEIKTAEKTRLVFSEASLGAVSPALFNLNPDAVMCCAGGPPSRRAAFT